MNMKLRYHLFLRRKSVYYAFDDTTKTLTSLKTKDKAEGKQQLRQNVTRSGQSASGNGIGDGLCSSRTPSALGSAARLSSSFRSSSRRQHLSPESGSSASPPTHTKT
jgi:hypothetical protein